MAIEEVVNNSADIFPGVISDLGKLALWLQAIGIIVLLWLIFNIISLIVNIRKTRLLMEMKEDIKNLDKKINKLSKKH